MKWISSDEKLPKSKGLYGVTNKTPSPIDFYFGYFDGVSFILPQQIDDDVFAYRLPKYWAKLEFGEDE